MNEIVTPLPHQEKNIELLLAALTTYGAALDASGTGTGKSATAIFLCKKIGATPAIICPLSTIPQWESTCRQIGVTPLFIKNYEACKSLKFKKGKKTPHARGFKYQWDFGEKRVIFIFDEVQRCRHQDTINSKMLVGAAKKGKTLMLSATPFLDPMEAYAIGGALKLFPWSMYFSWVLNHGVRKDPFGHFKFNGDPMEMERIHHDIFPSRGVRTRQHEIPDFPETLIVAEAVGVDNPGAIEKRYLDILAKKVQLEAAKAAENFMEVDPLTQFTRQRQEIELLKLKAIVEKAEDASTKGFKVAIFANFRATLEALATILGLDQDRHIIEGGQNNFVRFNALREFQNNRLNYLLINNAAGGAGISLHDVTGAKVERCCLISPPLSAINFRQVLGRSQRHGGGFSSQHILFAAETVEERRIMPRVKAKLNNLDTLLDSDIDISKMPTE